MTRTHHTSPRHRQILLRRIVLWFRFSCGPCARVSSLASFREQLAGPQFRAMQTLRVASALSLASSRKHLASTRYRTLQTLRVGQALPAWPPSPLPFPRCQPEGLATLLRLRYRRSTPHGPHPRFQIWRFQPLSYSERPSATLRLADAFPVKARPVS